MKTLKQELNRIAGEWDGKESGLNEERAMEALSILNNIKLQERRANNLLNQ